MELATLEHTQRGGWSAPFPDLDSDRTLVLAFAAPGYRDHWGAPLRELVDAYPAAHVMGCSTAGEIHGAHLSDDTVAVAVARFADTRLRCATADPADGGSHRAGRDIGIRLRADDLRAVLVLSDGLQVNGTELTRGLGEVLPPDVVVTGGLAADGDRFGRTWVLLGGRPASGVITAVGLYGDALRVGHGSQGGWDRFGPERLVTRSAGPVLHELDGRPALALYREYLGDRAAGLPATGLLFPLALRPAGGGDAVLVRTILAVDDAAQTLTFAGDIPQGAMVQLMRATFDRLIDGAGSAAIDTATAAGDGPVLCVGVSCVGRRLVLGERTEEEIEAVLDGLPEGTRQVGFYSYGEISPLAAGRCDLHNQTMTLTTLAETA